MTNGAPEGLAIAKRHKRMKRERASQPPLFDIGVGMNVVTATPGG
jgi:hypothetical protein